MAHVTYGWGQPAMVFREPVPEEVTSVTLALPEAAQKCHPHMPSFYDSPLLSDVVLVSSDGRRYDCHRLLLSAWSQPLCVMLTGEMVEGRQPEVVLPHVDSTVLQPFLQFLYCCSCQVPAELLPPLLSLSDHYDVASLTWVCREMLTKHGRNYKSCLRFWRGARAAGLPHLAAEAWQLLRQPHTWVGLMTDKQTRDSLTEEEEEELYTLEVDEQEAATLSNLDCLTLNGGRDDSSSSESRLGLDSENLCEASSLKRP